MTRDIADQQVELFFVKHLYQAEIAADRVRRLVERVDAQGSPKEWLGGQALLYPGRQRQVLLHLSLILLEPRVCCTELLFGAFLFRNIGQRRDRETLPSMPMHCTH